MAIVIYVIFCNIIMLRMKNKWEVLLCIYFRTNKTNKSYKINGIQHNVFDSNNVFNVPTQCNTLQVNNLKIINSMHIPTYGTILPEMDLCKLPKPAWIVVICSASISKSL